MANKKIQVDLEVKDKGTKQVEKFSKATIKSFDKINKVSSKVNNAFKTITKHITLAAAAATAAATAMASMTTKAIATADAIAKTADMIGLATDRFQALRFAAELAGISQDNFVVGMRRFVRQIDDARKGTGNLYKIFQKYGIALYDVDGTQRDTISIMMDFADVIANTTDGQERLNLTFRAFGMFGTRFVNLLKGGSAAMREAMQQARKYGLIIDENILRKSEEINDKITLLKTVIKTKYTSILLEIAPTLEKIVDKTTEWIKKNKELIDEKVVKFIEDLKNAFGKLGRALDWVVRNWGAIKVIITTLGGIWASAKVLTIINAVSSGINLLIKFIGGLVASQAVIFRAGKAFATLATGITSVAGALAKLAPFIRILSVLGTFLGVGSIIYEIMKAKPVNNIDEDAAIKKYIEKHKAPAGINKKRTGRPLIDEAKQYWEEQDRLATQNAYRINNLRKQLWNEELARRKAAMIKQAASAKQYMSITNAQYGAALHPETRTAEEILRSGLPAWGSREELMNRLYAAHDRALQASAQKNKEYVQSQLELINKMKQFWGNIANYITDTMSGAFADILTGVTSIKNAFADLFRSVSRYLVELGVKLMIMAGLKAMFGGTSWGKLIFGRYGIPGGFQAFAGGGVVKQPTLGLIGEGANDEAVIPLRNGKVPVQLNGHKGMVNNINVTINNPQIADKQSANTLINNIGDVIKSHVISVIQDQQRPGGVLARSAYGY